MKTQEIIGDYEKFITNVTEGLEQLGIARDEISMMDHVCYRVETKEQYRQMFEKLASIGVLLGESEVGGRMIATFELNTYLQAAGWTVPFVELPEPKDDSPYREGLEHAELVVVGSLERFLMRHKELSFEFSGMNKTINPEASLKTDDISVKFHEQQLSAVVRIEKQLEVVKGKS